MVIITLFNKVTKDHWKLEMSDYVKYPSIKLFFKKKKRKYLLHCDVDTISSMRKCLVRFVITKIIGSHTKQGGNPFHRYLSMYSNFLKRERCFSC